MATFRIDSTSKVAVTARSSVHDTTTVFSKVSGAVTLDVDTLLGEGGATNVAVNMTVYDTGDWLKNRKLRSDYDMDKHPTASFELLAIKDVVRNGTQFSASAEGNVVWRGKKVAVTLRGKGEIGGGKLSATGSFPLDIRKLGLTAPKVLMFKVEDEVAVEVTLHGSAQ
jgi:YceI-like domain